MAWAGHCDWTGQQTGFSEAGEIHHCSFTVKAKEAVRTGLEADMKF